VGGVEAVTFKTESSRFLHFHGFDREWANLGLTDEALRSLQTALVADPSLGPVVSGTGGLRKARFTPLGAGRGKSGAFRVGYVHLPRLRTILLVTIWGKNQKANISQAERNALAKAIREVEQVLEQRENE
jgi:hypothetical protein